MFITAIFHCHDIQVRDQWACVLYVFFFLHLIFKTINFIGFYKNIPHGLNFLFLNGSSPDIVEEAVL